MYPVGNYLIILLKKEKYVFNIIKKYKEWITHEYIIIEKKNYIFVKNHKYIKVIYIFKPFLTDVLFNIIIQIYILIKITSLILFNIDKTTK